MPDVEPVALRVAAWNVNSIGPRLGLVLRWADQAGIDVLLLGETRCEDSQFPHLEFMAAGFEVAHVGQKGRNGVAVASRVGLDGVELELRDAPLFGGVREARYVSGVCAGVRLAAIYVPNGRELTDPHYTYKLEWLDALCAHVATHQDKERMVIGGDYNVAPADIDVWAPARWMKRTHTSRPERERLERLSELGFADLYRATHTDPGFTWWNYRGRGLEGDQGLRIDMLFVSAPLAATATRVWVDSDTRREPRPSDHAPVAAELVIPA